MVSGPESPNSKTGSKCIVALRAIFGSGGKALLEWLESIKTRSWCQPPLGKEGGVSPHPFVGRKSMYSLWLGGHHHKRLQCTSFTCEGKGISLPPFIGEETVIFSVGHPSIRSGCEAPAASEVGGACIVALFWSLYIPIHDENTASHTG